MEWIRQIEKYTPHTLQAQTTNTEKNNQVIKQSMDPSKEKIYICITV